jgi:hypothetical protein
LNYSLSFEDVEKTKSQDATPAFVREDYTYLKKSKRTLLMFRRLNPDQSSKLELRHQRTGDVVFDWIGNLISLYCIQIHTIHSLSPSTTPTNSLRLSYLRLWLRNKELNSK